MSATPPQNREAERGVLGALMVGSPELAADIEDMLRPADFYFPAHEAIFLACTAVARAGGRPDPITVARQLGPAELNRLGGAVHLHELTAELPLAANAPHYAEAVRDAALRRRLVEAGTRVVQLAHEHSSPLTAAEDARQLVDQAAASATTEDGGATVGDGIDSALDWLETPPVGADTPWPDVNRTTNGLLAGQMVTVAGRPGHGKSLAAKDVGVYTARAGRPVHIATLEMTRNEYMARILSGLARVDLGKMLRREMSDNEWSRVGQAANATRELPLYLDDRPQQTMAQIRAAARHTARRFGQQLGLIAIDYAQLVTPDDARAPREQQVAAISRQSKLIAKEMECPVMLLAQLNRGNVTRSDPRPMVSDLRESGSLEQDSDQVWLLHRPDQYGDEERLGEVDLIVGKNRNGPAPTSVSLAFQGHYASLVSMV